MLETNVYFFCGNVNKAFPYGQHSTNKQIEMVCCNEKEGKDYFGHKHTPEKVPSLKNKYVCTKGLSAGSFWGLQSFEWFSFTIKGIQGNCILLY